MNPIDQRDPELILDGARYRQSHKASVVGILGHDAPEVFSQGSLFYNLDRWTLRTFIKQMCDWARNNPECVPTHKNVHDWVVQTNSQTFSESSRAIVIAATPDKLPIRTACALTGGGYHEAFHTYYSCRRNLISTEIAGIILPRWAMLKDWSKYFKALLDWSNVIEDIRIERCGQVEFEGTFVPLCDLQDFILNMEAASDVASGKPINLMSGIVRGFRDIGLGYNTDTVQSALIRYKKDCPQALDLIRQGPLADLLQEAIHLKPSDDTGCLRLAMDVLITLGQLNAEGEEDSQSSDGQPGDGEQKCPKCGASAGKLVVRPMSDGNGGKVPGKGIVTCTVCGYQEEVSVEKKKSTGVGGGEGGGESKEQPRFEGFDDEEDPDQEQSGSGKGSGSKEKSDKKDGSGKGSSKGSGDKEKSDKEKDSGKGSDSKEEGESDKDPKEDGDSGEGSEKSKEGEDSESGEGGDSGEDSESGEGGDSGEDSESGEDSDAEGSAGSGDNQQSEQSSGGGAGGFQEARDEHPGNDWASIVAEALANIDISILDNNSALAGAVAETVKQAEKNIPCGEAPWKPFSPGLDIIRVVKPSSRGQAHDASQTNILLNEVKNETAFLRARLRNIVRAMEMTSVVHGVPKGRGLSSRFLVDSKITVAAGEIPQKAYYKKGLQMDMSMACAAVVDESGSMASSLRDVTRITLTLAEPFDAIQCPTMVIGFRDGRGWQQPSHKEHSQNYHRYNGILINVFKMWHERFNTVKWRFSNTLAEGGTPMSDGIQFAMKALEARPEARKFLFVVTDGEPNSEHRPVVKHQIKVAREKGIDIIGVGMGDGALSVKTLFDDYVWVRDGRIKELPRLLIAKLNELADRQAGLRRNRKIHG